MHQSHSHLPKKLNRSYILLAYLSLMIQGLADNIRGPLFPDLLEQFHLDNKVGSLFFSIASGMIIAGGYLGSYLLEKWGRIRTLQFSTLILLLSILGIWQSPSFSFILIAVFFFGIAFGILGVAQNVMVIEASPTHEVQKWQSGLQSMYGLSSLTAPLLVSLMHSMGYPWQTSFLVAAVLTGLLLVGSLFIKNQPPALVAEKKENSKGLGFEMFYFGFILAAYVAVEIMVSSRLAQFTREVAGWDFSSTGTLNSLFFVGMFAGRLMFVFWRPPLTLKTQMIASLVLAVLALTVGILVNPVGLAIAGLAMAPFYPLCMTMAGRLFPKDLSRVAGQGIALTGVTVVAMQTLVGYFADQYGLKLSLFVGPGFALLALGMILLYQPLFKRSINGND